MQNRLVVALIAALLADQAAAAAQIVNSLSEVPTAVAEVYAKVCPDDNWIDSKRQMAGSTTRLFADGTQAYLLVCGDAASTIPFTAIVLSSSGEAHEASLSWSLRRKAMDDVGLSNARFGAEDSIISHAHVSATCEPTYQHVWDGKGFQLVSVSRHGCRAGE